MAERAPDPSIDRIREHARRSVAKTSLRKVAKAAGVKVGATKKFVDGSVPYERNARLWKKWYVRELREGIADAPDTALPTADAQAIVDLLLWSIPLEQREEARRDVVQMFLRAHADRQLTPPAWALELTGGQSS
ncbi:hypothetical protein [Longimicrobium sp.]|uniref:hypothetical protein n=1 Tax=Longimicrobium sp. TaxID=2029185 RepID=UPI002CFD28ED|nr:hypothetical protein [Longimicrobium sp.]HSU15421.1 hypothetical protein [Longimicrobium sp.]